MITQGAAHSFGMGLGKIKLLFNRIKTKANKASELPFSAQHENRGGL